MFVVKSCRKCAAKASPRPLFIFGKINQRKHCMEEIIFKIRYFERQLPKRFNKVNFTFSFKPTPFY